MNTNIIKRYCLYFLKSLNDLNNTIEVKYGDITKTRTFKENDFLFFETSDRVTIRLSESEEYFEVDLSDQKNGIEEIVLDSTVTCLLFFCDELENVFINDLSDSKVMGHRGTGQRNIKKTKERFLNETSSDDLYYENTVTSFKEAWERGAKWVELDIQLTKNEVPVIFHDFVLEIEGSKNGINELNDSEFLNYFSGPKDDIPTSLESIFTKIPEDLALNLEIKYPDHKEVEEFNLKDLIPINTYVDKILSVLSLQKPRKMCFSSFHPFVILYLRLRLPKSPVMFIIQHTGKTIKQTISFCSQAGLDGLVMDYESINTNRAEVVKLCKENNLKLFVYGSEISNENVANDLLEIGVDGIITDNLK